MPSFRQSPSSGDLPDRHRSPRDIALDELKEAAKAAIGSSSSQPMGLFLFRPEEEGAILPLHVERTVFDETFGNSAQMVAQEFGPYDHATLLVCVLDQHRRLPAGMLRIIFPSAQGLKTMNDIQPIWGMPSDRMFAGSGLDFNNKSTWDLATLAIAPEYRSAAFQGMVTMAMFQAISMIGMRSGFTSSVSVLHLPVLRMLQWKLHRPFEEPVGIEPRGYLESAASLPVFMELSDWHKRLQARDSALFDIMAKGSGLEPVIRSPDWDAASELAGEISALADLRLHLR